jgi:hypothetical protein
MLMRYKKTQQQSSSVTVILKIYQFPSYSHFQSNTNLKWLIQESGRVGETSEEKASA